MQPAPLSQDLLLGKVNIPELIMPALFGNTQPAARRQACNKHNHDSASLKSAPVNRPASCFLLVCGSPPPALPAKHSAGHTFNTQLPLAAQGTTNTGHRHGASSPTCRRDFREGRSRPSHTLAHAPLVKGGFVGFLVHGVIDVLIVLPACGACWRGARLVHDALDLFHRLHMQQQISQLLDGQSGGAQKYWR